MIVAGFTVGTITQASATGARVAAVAPDDADDLRADLPGVLQRRHQVRADVLLEVAAAHREHERCASSVRSRLPRSHSTNTLAQPSSLVRAVSSDTLSVGA